MSCKHPRVNPEMDFDMWSPGSLLLLVGMELFLYCLCDWEFMRIGRGSLRE